MPIYSYRPTELADFALDVLTIENLTRRRFLKGAGALGLGLLAGCGAPEEAAVPTAAATAVPTTRTVEHSMGTTEIPNKPGRIVTLSIFELGWPLAQLGVTTVGHAGEPEALQRLKVLDPESAALLEQSELVGWDLANPEKIAALQPDLIIGASWNTDLYDKLSQIAPTVLLDFAKATDIVAEQRALGELVGADLGPNSPFGQRLARYEQRINALKQAHPEWWPSLEWTRFNDYFEKIYIVDIHPNLPGVKVFTDLGAKPSKTVAQFPVSYAEEVSLETVAEYDADVIFVSAANAQPNPKALELLKGTFAGQRDQVFGVQQEMWSFPSIQGCLLVLDEIERAFAGRTLDTSGDFR
jgi:iron complex transport system substrate-binding protein